MITSQAQFARECKVTKQAISKAIKAGLIIATENGKIESRNAINAAYYWGKRKLAKDKSEATPLVKQPSPAQVQSKKISNIKATQSTAGQDVRKKIPSIQSAHEISPEQIELFDIEHFRNFLFRNNKTDLDVLKLMENIQGIQVKVAKDRGKLIDRKILRAVFNKLYLVDVNQWRTLGASLTPEIISITETDDPIKITQITECIEKEVFIILQHVKRILNDFLAKMEMLEIE